MPKISWAEVNQIKHEICQQQILIRHHIDQMKKLSARIDLMADSLMKWIDGQED